MSSDSAAVVVLHEEEPPARTVSELESADPIAEVRVEPVEEVEKDVENPDCVVAAIAEGTEAVETADEAFPRVPVLALAPTENGVNPESVLDAGATDFLRRDEEGRTVLPRRVETHAKRRRTERRFEAALDDPTAAVCLLDPEGRVERANDAARSLAAGEVAGERFWDLPWCERAARGRESFRESVEQALAGGTVTIEAVVGCGGGFDAEMVLRPVTEAGETTGVVAEVRGITQEGVDWEHRPLLGTIVENVPVVLFAFDSDGEFLLSEGKGLDRLGLDPGEVVGESVFELYADHEGVLDNCRRALDGERIEDVVEVDGTAFDTWYHPIEEDGEVTKVIGAALDVTDLQERNRELERQNERLEEFASIVSHDLRNPLNVARGAIELLKDDPSRENVERAESALDRMSDIVDDVLTLARTGETVEEYEAVDLGDVARGAWRAIETGEGSLSVEDSEVVRADPGRLQRLLENLLANAVEHGGSEVSVTVGTFEEGFHVADDGPGIPEGEREEVFESSYSTDEEGTGFGLAIVREIAQAHGWETRAKESESGGARFEITGVEFAG